MLMTKQEHKNISVVTKEMMFVMESIYSIWYISKPYNSTSTYPKIRMVGVLKTLSKIKDPENPFPLKECKDFVETHWGK